MIYYCLNSSGFEEKRVLSTFFRETEWKRRYICKLNDVTTSIHFPCLLLNYLCNTLSVGMLQKIFWKIGKRKVASVHIENIASVHIENTSYHGMCSFLKQFMSLKMSHKFHIQFYLNQESYESYLSRFKFKHHMLLEHEKHTIRLE